MRINYFLDLSIQYYYNIIVILKWPISTWAICTLRERNVLQCIYNLSCLTCRYYRILYDIAELILLILLEIYFKTFASKWLTLNERIVITMFYSHNKNCNILILGRNSTEAVDENARFPYVLPTRDTKVRTYPRKRMYLRNVLSILKINKIILFFFFLFNILINFVYLFDFEMYYPTWVQWISVGRPYTISISATFVPTYYAIHKIPIRMCNGLREVLALKQAKYLNTLLLLS